MLSTSSSSTIPLPVSYEAHNTFTKVLGIIPPAPENDLVTMLASVLQASPAGVETSITPGDLASIIAVLQVFLTNADEAQSQHATQEGSSLIARLQALIGLYQWQLDASTPMSNARLLVLSFSIFQIGTIVSSEPSPSNSKERYGWERLNEIFYIAFGDESYWPDSVRYLDNQYLMEWCGIFALWAYRLAGLDVGTWKVGSGINAVAGMESINLSQALPGDVAIIAQPYQHHFLILSIENNQVPSVDGNTTAIINGITRSGTIWKQTIHKPSDISWVCRPKDYNLPSEGGKPPSGPLLGGKLITPPPGTVGLDRSDTIASTAASLYAEGYRFAFRTLSLADTVNAGVLTVEEAVAIFAAGLMIGLYQRFRTTGITPEQGTRDGQAAANQAKSLGAPSKMVLWCDLEGANFTDPDGNKISSATMIQYLNNWAAAVIAGGYAAGLYNGPQNLVSGADLSALPNYHAYWQAAAQVPTISRGYQVLQLNPANYVPPGMSVNIDIDVVQEDFRGDSLAFWKG